MPKVRGRNRNYTNEDLHKALDAIQQTTMSILKAAGTYKVPKTIILDMLAGRYPEEKRSRTVLTPEEENKLVKWLRDCARAGEGKDKEQLCRTVQGILNAEGRQTVFTNNKPGYKWYAGFMERHKDQLTERKAMVLGEQRAQVTESKICGWFQYAQKILLESSNISKE